MRDNHELRLLALDERRHVVEPVLEHEGLLALDRAALFLGLGHAEETLLLRLLRLRAVPSDWARSSCRWLRSWPRSRLGSWLGSSLGSWLGSRLATGRAQWAAGEAAGKAAGRAAD